MYMKRILVLKFILLTTLIMFVNECMCQQSGSFTVGGDFNTFYPVVFIDGGWDNNSETELNINRFLTHQNSDWRGSLSSKFTFHTTNWGHGASHINATIYSSVSFIAGWIDGSQEGTRRAIIWMRGGGTTYQFNSNYTVAPAVYDSPSGYEEPRGAGFLNRPPKTSVDTYVMSNGHSLDGSLTIKNEKIVSFTPTTQGWYRIVDANGPFSANHGGLIRIAAGYDNRITDIELQYSIGGYNTGGSIQQTRYSSYNSGCVDQVRISSDGVYSSYLDIHINSATSPGPVTIYGYGPNLQNGLVLTPVAGAIAGVNQLNVLTMGHGFRSTKGAVFAETDGVVGIGLAQPDPNAKLDVNGDIYCRTKLFIGAPTGNTNSQIANYSLAVSGDALMNKIRVKLYGTWPDYVFGEKYKLLSLPELEKYIVTNKHLPDIPSADDVDKQGIELGGNQAMLVKKIEELTLYLIAHEKDIKELNKKVEMLSKENARLRKPVKKII